MGATPKDRVPKLAISPLKIKLQFGEKRPFKMCDGGSCCAACVRYVAKLGGLP
eukprot:NODE_9620_length_225_cov_44.892045_g9005_i0.p1 GENE.NODE_9620_length_225_cov_44.892045_g9005_i0~~NODE_9620_length_225_cov_44.892045_g9005_i0.p1  ORF type:complete len:53 (+),score=4.71 NODE_9620_length_225_cov_44.892045_g9005_i0:33-191(+)